MEAAGERRFQPRAGYVGKWNRGRKDKVFRVGRRFGHGSGDFGLVRGQAVVTVCGERDDLIAVAPADYGIRVQVDEVVCLAEPLQVGYRYLRDYAAAPRRRWHAESRTYPSRAAGRHRYSVQVCPNGSGSRWRPKWLRGPRCALDALPRAESACSLLRIRRRSTAMPSAPRRIMPSQLILICA